MPPTTKTKCATAKKTVKPSSPAPLKSKASTKSKTTKNTKSSIPDIEDLITFDPNTVSNVQSLLLAWYDDNRRKLPWRGDVDVAVIVEKSEAVTKELNIARTRSVSPYETWVSEIMCQQTRVDTVIGYFTKWIARFPTVKSLAEASPDDVNAMWAGLGYYSRARNLHKGAKYVMNELNGNVPGTVDELLKIPGIGAYTAGAVASISFKRNVPVVDGNVIRFLSRICTVSLEAKDKNLYKACWKGAARLVDGTSRPGDLNQAMMELGATCCTPKNPTCSVCPVQRSCRAFANDPLTVTKYPLPATKKVLPEFNIGVMVVVRGAKLRGSGDVSAHKKEKKNMKEDDQYLMWKRPATGLLAGQWEFACSVLQDTDVVSSGKGKSRSVRAKPMVVKNKVLKELSQRMTGSRSTNSRIRDKGCTNCRELVSGAKAPTLAYVDTFTHVFSHVKHKMLVHTCQLACACASPASGGFASADGNDAQTANANLVGWMTMDQMGEVGVTKQVTQVLGLVQKFHRTPRLSFDKSVPSVVQSGKGSMGLDFCEVVDRRSKASTKKRAGQAPCVETGFKRTRRPRACNNQAVK